MATYYQSEIKETIDRETGELVTVETSKSWRTKVHHSQEFYMVFVNWISLEYKIKSLVAKSILVWMLTNAEYNTGRVLIPTEVRNNICNQYEISNTALSNALKTLKDLGIIQGDRGVFYINPELFWKGELSVRNQVLENSKIVFTISIEDD